MKAVVRKVTNKGKTKFVAPKAVVKKVTKKGKSYWGGTGAYSKELTKLEQELVPDSGEANSVHGELVRAIGRLFYDFCNNGNCNVIEVKTEYETETHTCDECYGNGEVEDEDAEEDENEERPNKECPECGGSGEKEEEVEVDGEIVIDDYYQRMIDVIYDELPDKTTINALDKFLHNRVKGYGRYTFSDDEMKVYNDLCDAVMYHVLTTKNRERMIDVR
jgi:Zn finger protein HypA/HybF involved in hydrogenase expression